MTFLRHGASIYRTKRWAAVRKMAKDRDDWKCTECSAVGRLEVHHKKPVRTNPELAYDLDNLQTLCQRCHIAHTRRELGQAEITPEMKAWDKLLRAGLPDFNKT